MSGRASALLASALLAGCAAAQPAAAPSESVAQPEPAPALPPGSPAPEPSSGPVAPAAPVESAGFQQAMATLRPAQAEPVLSALAAAPADAAAYSRATLAYAATDVPGMALLWGLTYRAMGGGPDDAAVASALAKILRERISVKRDDATDQVAFNVRLAPGQMPTRQYADGSVEAPLAHVFEALFGTTLTGFRQPWTIEQLYDSLSTWAGLVSTRGTPLDERVELDAWLVELAKAGQLEPFCYRLLGSAFPAELKEYKSSHAAELKAFDAYLAGARLAPTRAPLPDDLVRLK